MFLRQSTILLLALASFACGAAPNPKRPDEAGLWKIPPLTTPQAGAAKPIAPAAAPVATDDASSAVPAPPSAVFGIAPVTKSIAAQDAQDPTVAHVAGESIGVRELLSQWVHQQAGQAMDQLDRLILAHIVLAEAQRIGVRVDPERAEQAYLKSVSTAEKAIAEKKPGVSLDQWIDQALNLDPLVYRKQLRANALQELIAERAVRAFVLESERAEMRVIVVKSEDKVHEVQAALTSGEDFAAVASRLSSDPSSTNGGRVPPVLRSETLMGRLAFDTKIGEVGGPTFSLGAWLFVKVEARPQPLAGSWPDIAAAVEASLAQRGLEDLELSQWKAIMQRRYPADLSPFLRLAGQTSR